MAAIQDPPRDAGYPDPGLAKCLNANSNYGVDVRI